MGYIGREPSVLPITSSDLANDIVSSNAIADDSISEEHIDNTAITGFGALTSLADTDKFLVSDASDSGNLKYVEKQYLPSGGLVYVGGASNINTATSQVNVDNVFSGTYRSYRVIIEATVGSNTADTRMKLRDASGDISVSSKYFAILAGINQSGSVQASTQTKDDHFRLFENTFNDSNSDYPVGCCELTIYAPNISTDITHITMTGSYLHSGGEERARYGSLILQAQKGVTGLALYSSTGNMNDVQVKVYGMVDS